MHQTTYNTIHNNEISSTTSSDQFIFRIPPSVHWRNFFNSHFEITVRLLNQDDTALGATECAPINGIGMALLKSFDLFVGDKRLISHELHNYTSYFENKWTISKNVVPTWPVLFGWSDDEHGKFDIFTDAGNSGFKSRRALLKNDWDTVFYVKPNVFPFTVDKLFPPDLDFRFEVERTPDNFLLMAVDGTNAKFVIKKISLVLENVVIKPSVEPAMLSRISKSGALYDFTQVRFQSYYIPKDQTVFELTHHNLIWPTMPTLLLFGIVTEKSFIGNKQTNPYSLKHNSITDIQIKINGADLYNTGSLKLNFAKADYSSAYKEILSTLDYMWADKRAPTVSYHAYDNDNVFFAANIARKFPETINSASNSQELTIAITFAAATTENLRLLVYPTYKNCGIVSGGANERVMNLMYN